MKQALFALKLIVFLVIFAFFALWASARWLVTTGANSYFEQNNMGMHLTLDKLSLNVFAPAIALEGVTLTLPDQNKVALRNLELVLQYAPLFSKQLVIEKFVINDFDVRYHVNKQNSDNTEPTQALNNKEDEDKTNPSSPMPNWTVLINTLRLNNILVDANIAGQQLKTNKSHFHLNNSLIQLEQQQASTELDVAVTLAAEIPQQTAQQNSSVKVNLDNLRLKTAINAEQWLSSPALTLADLALDIKTIKTQLPDIVANINRINLQFSKFDAKNLLTQPKLSLSPELEFNVEKLFARHLPSQSVLADINGFAIDQLGADLTLAEQPNVALTLDNIHIKDILLLKYDALLAQQNVKQKTNNPPETGTDSQSQFIDMFTMTELNIGPIKAQTNSDTSHLDVDVISFGQADSTLLLHALPNFGQQNTSTDNEQSSDSVSMARETAAQEKAPQKSESQPSTTKQSDQAATSSESTSSFTYRINSVSHEQPITVHIQDKSVRPAFDQKIVIDQLQLAQLDSDLFNVTANLHATLNGYSQLLLDVNPHTKINKKQSNKDTMLVDAKLSNFDLVSVSPYVKKAADMTIERGNIDVNAAVNINHIGWQGDVHLVLKSLGVSTVNTDHNVSVEDEKVDFIPLNVLLDKISDSKGHLEIDLPIEGKQGQLSGLTTGIIRNVVEIVTTEAAKSYLVQTFVPYSNIVSIAQYAGNKLFEIHIEDLVFPSGQSTLPEEQLKVFDAYAKLIKEQQDLVITVCPIATWADLAIPPSNSGEQTKSQALSEQQINQLYELAKQREVYFKQQLMAKNTDMSRLVSCATKISKNTNKSGYLSFTTKG